MLQFYGYEFLLQKNKNTIYGKRVRNKVHKYK